MPWSEVLIKANNPEVIKGYALRALSPWSDGPPPIEDLMYTKG